MRNLVKLKVIILILSIFFAQKSIAADIILPLPKPIVDEKTEITATKKKYIYPLDKGGSRGRPRHVKTINYLN